jgi:transcriptional regulator with XRE-family HTH domain
VFFDQLQQLCKEKGVSMTRLVTDIGMHKSAVTYWRKSGTTPKMEVVEKIADYFDISANYFLNEKTSPAETEDDELNNYLEELKNRKEMRMLFKLASGATKEDVEKAVAIIEALSR